MLDLAEPSSLHFSHLRRWSSHYRWIWYYPIVAVVHDP